MPREKVSVPFFKVSVPFYAARVAVGAGALMLAGCKGAGTSHTVLAPAGVQAERIYQLWELMLWVCVGVYAIVLVMAVLPAVIWRQPGVEGPGRAETMPPAPTERRLGIVVGSAVGVTVVILFVLLISDFVTGRRVYALSKAPNQIDIQVTGHRWWWEVHYKDATPSNEVTDANEIHIPVGRPVRVELSSHDVIHSFWVPNLQGKKDMIPGHPTNVWIEADKPGRYWGQCAEFCGFQHAHMRILVKAESEEQFNAFLAHGREPAAEPVTDSQKRGQQVFLSSSCVTCHTISGTTAGGMVGPDLTHLASRETIAAGTRANGIGHLGGWVVDPQTIKPGVIMPQNALKPDDLQALLEYLDSLK